MPETQVQPDLGQVVRELRGEKGFASQTELAEAAEVSTGVVERLEAGRTVQTRSLAKIASALQTNTEDLKNRAIQRRIANRNSTASTAHEPQTVAFGLNHKELEVFFDAIDHEIEGTFGALYSPRQKSHIGFSSRKLFSSLSVIDMPPEIILEIIATLPSKLRQTKEGGSPFSTSDIRLAVAEAISSIPEAAVVKSLRGGARIAATDEGSSRISANDRKFDWVKRYCRRYGDPNQAITMIEEDGTQVTIAFNYLKAVIVPHMLRRLLGPDFHLQGSQIVSATTVSDMASRLLEEFRRLNLYFIRYRTALYLAEEIATQPPHPWLVTRDTQKSTVAYDVERARAHLAALKGTKPLAGNEHWHRYTEVIHHCCSAILGNYGSFIGHKYLFSLHVLKTWLSIGDSNTPLWSFCELNTMTVDLGYLKILKDEFVVLLRRIEVVCNSRRIDAEAAHLKNAERLFEIAEQLIGCRERMRDRRTRFAAGLITPEDMLHLTQEALASAGIATRSKPIVNRSSGRQIGWSGNVDYAGTGLVRKSPLSLFIVDPARPATPDRSTLVQDAVDAIQAHRFSDVSFLVVRASHLRAARKLVEEVQTAVGAEKVVLAVSLEFIFSCRHKEEFIDRILD